MGWPLCQKSRLSWSCLSWIITSVETERMESPNPTIYAYSWVNSNNLLGLSKQVSSSRSFFLRDPTILENPSWSLKGWLFHHPQRGHTEVSDRCFDDFCFFPQIIIHILIPFTNPQSSKFFYPPEEAPTDRCFHKWQAAPKSRTVEPVLGWANPDDPFSECSVEYGSFNIEQCQLGW